MKITIDISKEDYDFIKRIPREYLSNDYLNVRLYNAVKDGAPERKLRPTLKSKNS